MKALLGFVAALAFAAGCSGPAAQDAATVIQQQRQAPERYDPVRDLGGLFKDVQLSGIFEDSKTFVDARPRFAPTEIIKLFTDERRAGAFDLRSFVTKDF